MAVVSNLKNYPLSVMWEAERPEPNISRKSSCFRLLGEQWYLELEYVYDHNYYDNNYIEVRICSSNDEILETGFSVTCHVIANRLAFGGSSDPFTVRNAEDVIFQSYVTRNEHNTCQATRKWKIFCHFSCGTEPVQREKTSKQTVQQVCPEIPPDFQQLSDDFSSLLAKEIMPDATLMCGSRTWRVHKSVLTVRSEVFAALFRSGMSESKTGEVRIEDLDPAVLESLLKYVYGGKVPDVSCAGVSGLYAAADKYALHSLRKLLSRWMAEHLSLQNCLEFIAMADAHADDELKEASVAFITQHFAEIEKAAWANFRKKHLALVVEVLEHFAPAMKK